MSGSAEREGVQWPGAGRCRHYTTQRSQFKCPGDKLKLATGCSVDTVSTMEAGPLVEAALAACPQLRRVAWTPTLQEAGQEQGAGQGADPLATRFGGNTPFRPDNFRWPICEECHAHKVATSQAGHTV